MKQSCSSAPGLSGAALINEAGELVAINKGVLPDGTAHSVTMAEVLADSRARAIIEQDKRAFAAGVEPPYKASGELSPTGTFSYQIPQ